MEYIIIYGSSPQRREPFILAVTNDQKYINGFKSDFYDYCHDYKIVNDNKFEMYYDYHIREICNHYVTEKMLTEFYEEYLNIYYILLEFLNTDIDIFKWTDAEMDRLELGFDIITSATSSGPIDIDDLRYSSETLVSMDIVDIPKLLETFIYEFQIDDRY